uniref:C2H2-type domain-containing protein n=1 Tax=Parastrongyloides trichosuri TaxID=131310 RepID=A0A0N4Z1X6_PARTI
MSYCDVNPSPTNQSTNMDDSVDSGIVRRSLRSNVRCNYKDMANGTKKTTNTVNNDIDRSRSLSATRKIKIKPVIRKSEQTSTGCTQNHNCVNNLTHKAKSISQNNTTDDESSITSHPSPSVSPETNNHGNEICNLTGANNKRNRRPPSAHKDYLNEKQVKEIQKSRSKNSSKSHTPDPSHITKGFDNSNNSVKSNHEITNEVMKKLNSELKIEINKNHIIEPRNSISPPIRMSITRGRGSVSPKIISCTVNAESDGVVNSNNDIPFNNKFNVESEIKKCPENNSIIQETTEVVQKEKVQEIVEKNVVVSEGPCSKIVSNVLPILEKEKPLVKIEVPEVNEEVSIRHDDNIGDKFKEECPTLACMEVVSDPPKLDIEEINDPKPILEPVIIEPLKPLENSNSADGSGPPLLEPVPEGPQEDSFEDLDLKCHEDLELIDIDLPKSEAIEIKEEVVESTTVNSKQTKGYTFRNANKNNDSKSSIKRSYNKNSNKYKCSECGFNGSKMADLKMHAKTHSNTNNRGGKRRKVDDSGSKNDSDIKDTSGGNDDLVDQETKNIKLNTLYTVDETDRGDGFEKLYRCKECPFTNSTIPRIENHVLGHTKRLGFKCPVCTYFCGSAGFMKKHTILHGDDCPWPPQFYGARKGGNSRYYTPNKVETKKEETLSPTNATTENSHVTDNMRTVWKYFMIQKKIKQKTCHVKKCQFKGTAMSCILHKLFYHKEVQGTLKVRLYQLILVSQKVVLISKLKTYSFNNYI